MIDYLGALSSMLADTDIKIHALDETGSTNADAKRYAACDWDRSPALVVAGAQSAGRGRLGRSFLSRDGQGIYMSLLYFTSDQLSDAVSVTVAASVAVALSIEEAVGDKMMIKWVNDVYNRHGKVCGILVETVAVDGGHAIIVGIGINTGSGDFPEDLMGIAATLGDLDADTKALIASRSVLRLLDYRSDLKNKEYMKEYRSRFMLNGKEVNLLCAGERVGNGRVVGVDDDGGLLVDDSGEIKTVRSGEVSVRCLIE